ncbi:MAG: PD-(D/E)XK nuclease family protein [Rhizobiales bacterium]|nr:PD-(D/E)XK nuclease family protein [Hyphomicrobiales bacterium]
MDSRRTYRGRSRQWRQAARRNARRHHRAGAKPWSAVRRDPARPEARRGAGCGRRPAETHRKYRSDGYAGAGRRASARARRSLAPDNLASATTNRYAEAAGILSRWREAALHLRPFDFYSRVLGRDGGRKKMIARLGPEAADALDEFLGAALSYESAETPSLHGFLSLLRRAETEVKRDLEAEGAAVRVMTVHGVKGLEAPVVILADTTTLPPQQKEPRIVPVWPAAAQDAPPSLIWAARKDESSDALLAAREDARELRRQEYRRLLYVALTRAADVLVVCGALNKNQKNGADEGSWYDLVDKALSADSAHVTKHTVGYSKEEITRWRTPAFPPLAMARDQKIEHKAHAPDWLGQRWTNAETLRVKLRPSFAPREIAHEARAKEGGKTRGILLHRLLQSLPELAVTAREAAALRYLSKAAPDLSDAARAKLAQEALAVIAHPDCAEIFGPGSRAEPELIAHIRDGAREIEIPARIDRLLVTERDVIFADFKSDASPPASFAKIPEHYISQLAAYRAALAQALPRRKVRALLIFTAAPRVFEIPEETLESAWQRLKTQDSLAFQ